MYSFYFCNVAKALHNLVQNKSITIELDVGDINDLLLKLNVEASKKIEIENNNTIDSSL